jgi:hypothetical protein
MADLSRHRIGVSIRLGIVEELLSLARVRQEPRWWILPQVEDSRVDGQA